MTDWKWRVHLFVKAADKTAQNKQAFAEIFANNGSMETVENERKCLDSVVRLSRSGAEPAEAYGMSTLVLPDMRPALQDFITGLSLSRWYAVANIPLNNYAPGELIASNGGAGVVGEAWTWQDALDDLFNERGLQVIEAAL